MAIRPYSDIMLDTVSRLKGNQGGDTQCSAYMILACTSTDENEIATCIKRADELGMSTDRMVNLAVESDSPLTLKAIMTHHHLDAQTVVAKWGCYSPIDAFAITAKAFNCLDMLLATGSMPISTTPDLHYGDMPYNWLSMSIHAGAHESFKHLLAHHCWSKEQLQEAASYAVAALEWSRAAEVYREKHQCLNLLIERGARWSDPSPNDLTRGEHFHTLAHQVASLLFSKTYTTGNNSAQPEPILRQLWSDIQSHPDWINFGPTDCPLALHALSQKHFPQNSAIEIIQAYPEIGQHAQFWPSITRQVVSNIQKDKGLRIHPSILVHLHGLVNAGLIPAIPTESAAQCLEAIWPNRPIDLAWARNQLPTLKGELGALSNASENPEIKELCAKGVSLVNYLYDGPTTLWKGVNAADSASRPSEPQWEALTLHIQSIQSTHNPSKPKVRL